MKKITEMKGIYMLAALSFCAVSVALPYYASGLNTIAADTVPDMASGAYVTALNDDPAIEKGDVNCDNSLTVSDGILLARITAEDTTVSVTQQGMMNADMNQSGAPDGEDLVLILQELAGLNTQMHMNDSNGSEQSKAALAETTSIPENGQKTNVNTTSAATLSAAPIIEHIYENGNMIPFWDEKTFGEKYLLVSGAFPDGTSFSGRSEKKEQISDDIGECIGMVQLSGYDVYTDSSRYCEEEAYLIKDAADKIAVESDGQYYLYAINGVLHETTTAPSDKNTQKPVNTEPTSAVPVSSSTEHIYENGNMILFWDEKTFGEKYLLVSGAFPDGISFSGKSEKKELASDNISKCIGTVQLSGYDVYTDSSRYREAEAYLIKDAANKIAVESDGQYYLYAINDVLYETTTAPSDEDTRKPVNTEPTSAVPASSSTEHIYENGNMIPFWNEQTFGEKYLMVSGTLPDSKSFSGKSEKIELPSDKIGDYIGKVQLTGFDVYTDAYQYCEADAYCVTDGEIAVKSADGNAYYLYTIKTAALD